MPTLCTAHKRKNCTADACKRRRGSSSSGTDLTAYDFGAYDSTTWGGSGGSYDSGSSSSSSDSGSSSSSSSCD